MSDVVITVSGLTLIARLETESAPLTCEAFRKLLPLETHLLHVRWSGQAVWLPLGELALGVPFESATTYPAVGQVLLYPGGVSETEILMPYGPTCFSSRAGQLAGNHFLTVVSGAEHLEEIGHMALWKGVQTIVMKES